MYQQNEAESMAALELLHIKNNQPSNLECRSASKLLCQLWGEDSHPIDATVPSSSKVTTKKKKKKKSRASELHILHMLYHVLFYVTCTRCILYFVMHQIIIDDIELMGVLHALVWVLDHDICLVLNLLWINTTHTYPL